MTAPVPSSPVALLDQLDELRAKATPGPWHVGYESCDCGGGYPCGHEDYPYELVGPKRTDPSPNFPDYDHLVSEIAQLSDADATLIVAAVNALPELIADLRKHHAAVRAVLELADELGREANALKLGGRTSYLQGQKVADAADRIRAALSVTP